MKLSVIGSGNMGGALIKGWIRSKADLSITITAHTQKTLDRFKAEYPQLDCTLDNREAVAKADVVVLAVKPWLVDSVIAEITEALEGKILISVAANARNERIDAYVMPNIAAEFGQSMTFVEKGDSPAVEQARDLFALVGEVMVVEPRQMAAGMMMAGCGIAYVMRFLRAMMEGGVEMGLYPADALRIAMQTMEGAVTLLDQTGLHPEAAIDKVTTPGGITIKGLNELDHAGFNSAVVRCLKAGL
ncbi:MAG: pyrroline-5-carboxylate reductase [Bacteroidales bacterium]|nr:pyrroline-5-carboxylate reductase [Bacteroidales bacterium]